MKDCKTLIKEIEIFGVSIAFKYNWTNKKNPADLITRGISLRSLKNKVNFWTNGPNCLSIGDWPNYPLLSMSPEIKCKINTMNNKIQSTKEENINIKKYSNLYKLLSVVSCSFKFLPIVKGIESRILASNYLLKIMQKDCFKEEI